MKVAVEHSAARAYIGGLEGVGQVGDEHGGGAVSSSSAAGGRVAFRGGFAAAAVLLPLTHRRRRGGTEGTGVLHTAATMRRPDGRFCWARVYS